MQGTLGYFPNSSGLPWAPPGGLPDAGQLGEDTRSPSDGVRHKAGARYQSEASAATQWSVLRPVSYQGGKHQHPPRASAKQKFTSDVKKHGNHGSNMAGKLNIPHWVRTDLSPILLPGLPIHASHRTIRPAGVKTHSHCHRRRLTGTLAYAASRPQAPPCRRSTQNAISGHCCLRRTLTIRKSRTATTEVNCCPLRQTAARPA